ncbi:Na+/H+ antiporter NhaC [Sediminitomix flava]|uniref:Transporter (NhaC family) n=1 Tax=Sediminitomix flava TaxID=379075 RepID=A0A315ZAJ6_SEDFL|nr:Na+/H+ antiporter NhaC [Sediminitomix flava]PWJ42605.1 transporter (NhaC family) [Sediminitomix flava]
MNTFNKPETKRKPTIWEALIPIVFLIGMLILNVLTFGDAGMDGSIQIILIFSTAIASIILLRRGYSWEELQSGIVKSTMSAYPSILILLLIGALAGSWMVSGIVPAMIYYGLKVLNPTIFLVASCLICALVSVVSGSSWSTVATVGIALLGIGKALGFSEGLIAGAIISGAYFGDKISPLSDTTNLAPAVSGTDLFTHIRYMIYTTVPTFIITLIIFLVLGLNGNGDIDPTAQVSGVLSAIENKFNLTPALFLVPVIVFILILKKMPAAPVLLIGSLLGIVWAFIFQGDSLLEVAGENVDHAYFRGGMQALFGDISLVTESDMVNDLLSAGGMAGMLNTVWLILMAMAFGGVMDAGGLLKKLTDSLLTLVSSETSLVGSTAFSCIFLNVTTSDQYMSIVVPGKMYADAFKEKGLAPENLSRTLEDTGTVTSVLVPWNTCGATQAGVLGVPTLEYFYYCFFNMMSPIMTMLFITFKIKIKRLKEERTTEPVSEVVEA